MNITGAMKLLLENYNVFHVQLHIYLEHLLQKMNKKHQQQNLLLSRVEKNSQIFRQ